jgi:acid phosphatase
MQASVEYRAVCLTAFDRARLALDAALSDPNWTAALEQREADRLPAKAAVIVDIDETILDNSPYQAEMILQGKPFDAESWRTWVLLGRAEAVPGALEFIRYAEGRGVAVFYISNRDAETPGDRDSPQERATRRNLESLGLALPASEDTVLLKNEVQGWGSDKGSRRSLVAQSHRILLLVGDDFGDFLSGVRTNIDDRKSKADARRDMWGRGWIMLPNAMYGSWEGALSGYDNKLTAGEVLRKKRGHLMGIR